MGDFLSELYGYLTTSDWVGLCGLAAAVFYTLLTNRAKFFPTWDSPWRTVLGTVASGVGVAFGMVHNGTGTAAIVAALLQNTLPTLLAEIAAAVHGKAARPGGTGTIDLQPKQAMRPPPGPYAAALVGLSLTVMLAGCPKGGGTSFHWPDAASCAPAVGPLVGEVTQILFSDPSAGFLNDASVQKLEALAAKYGADAVLCLVDQLVRDWTSPAASPNLERAKAAARGQWFLKSTHTVLLRQE